MKRFLIGVALAFGFYFVGCIAAGAVVGFQAGMKDPQNAQAAGARAGEVVIEKYGSYIMVAAIAFGVLGAWIGVQPEGGGGYAGGGSEDALPITTWV